MYSNLYLTGYDGEVADPICCAQNISCFQYEDKVNISWNLPQDGEITIDFLIGLSNVKLNGYDIIAVYNTSTTYTVRASCTEPRIHISKNYIAIVRRRFSREHYYEAKKVCTKVDLTNITSKVTSDSVIRQHSISSQTTYRQDTTKQLTKSFGNIDSGYNPATTSQGTSKPVTKEHGTKNLVSTNEDTTKQLTKDFESGTLYGGPLLFYVIGSSVAGVVLLIVIVVIIVKLRKIKQSGNEIMIRTRKQKANVENNGPDEDDSYNHLSFDNQDRETKRAKQKSYLQDNEADEEGTYNHLSCDNQDRKTKIAKQNSELQDSNADEESTYNHLSRDNQERKTKLAKQNSYLKNNEVDEEGTYSHMSRDCQETSINMAQGNEEDTYNHLSLSHKTEKIETMSGEINVISVSVHAPTTVESAGKNEEIQVKTEKGNKTNTVVGNDDTESAAGFKQLDSLEDDFKEPSRRKGPKGDLYTEIEMK